MLGGFALGALALAVPAAFAQNSPYSDPSVIVDLSVLEKFGPPPNLPGLLRQSGQSAGGQRAIENGAAAGAPGRLLPPPPAVPQSRVTVPEKDRPETRTARPAAPRAKPAAPPSRVASQPKAAAPAKVTVEKPKAPPPPPNVATPEKPAPAPQPLVAAPPPPKVASKAEDAEPAKKEAEAPAAPAVVPPPTVTAPPVPVAAAEPASQAKTDTPAPVNSSDMATPPKVPEGAAAPSKPEERPSESAVTEPGPTASGKVEAEKQVAARTPGPEPKVSADGKTINIAFPPGSSELPGSVDAALGQLAQRMNADESLRLDILGYAAGEAESASQARRLSLFRALAVRSHLMKQGILSTRMNVRALGNNAEADAPADRVEIVVQQ